MLSSARLIYRPTAARRVQGAMLALLVQASFLLLVFFSPSRPVRTEVEKETLLLLPPLPAPKPKTIDARAPSVFSTAPPVVPPPQSSPPMMTAPLAPPAGLAGFGRSLFGCAPEHYADLTPDERAHCPKPGEGMAINQPPDLLNPPKSHSRDEALWLEEKAEAKWIPDCAGAVEVGFCMMHQGIAEHSRAQAARQKIADDKAARLAEPKHPLPNIGVRQN